MWLSQKSATCVAFSEVSTACQAAAEVSRGSLHSAIRCIGSLLVAIATHDVMLSQKSPQPCGCCRSLLAAFHFGSLHSTVGCIGSLWRPVLCSATCVAFSEWLPAISWKHPRHTVVTEVSSDMRHVLQHVLPFQNGCLPSFGSLHDVQSLRKSSATCVAFCNMLCLFGMAACHLSEVPTTHGHCGSLQQHVLPFQNCCLPTFGSLHDVWSLRKSPNPIWVHSQNCVVTGSLHSPNGCCGSLLAMCQHQKSPGRMVATEVSQSHLCVFATLHCHRKSPQPDWLLRKSPGQGLLPSLEPGPVNPHLLVLIDLMWPPIDWASLLESTF